MASNPMPLPPGATLVSAGTPQQQPALKLPPGAKLVSQTAPPPDAPAPEDHTVLGFLKNAVSSAADMGANVVSAVRHLPTTLNNTLDLAGGIAEEHMPGFQAVSNKLGETPQQTAREHALADGFIQSLKDRYGSLDNFGHTLYHDPVGVLADLSTVAGGVGAAAGKLGKVAELAKLGDTAATLGKVADAAGTVAHATDPVSLAAKGTVGAAGAIGSRTTGKVAEALYQSALKPSTANDLDEIQGMVQSGLKNSIPVSPEGLNKLNGLIDNWKQAVKAKVQAGAGATIDPQAVAQRVADVEARFRNQPTPAADLAAIDKVRQEFLAEHSTPGSPAQPILGANGKPLLDASGNPILRPAVSSQPVPIPLEQAQAMKQGGGSILSKKYGEMSSAATEAQKALVRGLKEEIATQFPEIAALNEKLAPAYDLQPALESALKRIGNKDPVSLGTKVLMGAHGSAPALLHEILSSSEIRSRLALALQAAAKNSGAVTATGGKIAVPTYRVFANRVDQYANALADAAADQTQ